MLYVYKLMLVPTKFFNSINNNGRYHNQYNISGISKGLENVKKPSSFEQKFLIFLLNFQIIYQNPTLKLIVTKFSFIHFQKGLSPFLKINSTYIEFEK